MRLREFRVVPRSRRPCWLRRPPRFVPVASVREPNGSIRLERPIDQPRVQGIITDLAARCVTIEPEAIDDAIADGLQQIGEALAVDLAVLCRKSAEDENAIASHSWTKHQERSLLDPLEVVTLPFVASTLENGEPGWLPRIDQVRDPDYREAFLRHGIRSAAVVPVALTASAPAMRGALILCSTAEHEWTPPLIEQLRLLSGVVGQALARRANLEALQQAFDEVNQLRARVTEGAEGGRPEVPRTRPSSRRDRLQPENLYLRRDALGRPDSGSIVGQSATVRRVLEQARQVAATDSTVLLLGETGTGKELIARTSTSSARGAGARWCG